MTVDVCSRCLGPEDRRWIEGTTLRAGVCVRCRGQSSIVLNDAVLRPRLAYRGRSPFFSSSHELLPYQIIVWDVNSYYRDLGCRPGASRRELVDAYKALGPEPGARQTFCLKQLLDPEVRERYDRCQPGELFFDEVLARVVRRRAAAARAEALAAAEEDPLDEGVELDLSEALNQALSVLDTDEVPAQDVPTAEWGYFLWNTFHSDPGQLDEWRRQVSDALWRRGEVHTRVGVGYQEALPSPVAIAMVDGVSVFFLNTDADPTTSTADLAVEIHQGQHAPLVPGATS